MKLIQALKREISTLNADRCNDTNDGKLSDAEERSRAARGVKRLAETLLDLDEADARARASAAYDTLRNGHDLSRGAQWEAAAIGLALHDAAPPPPSPCEPTIPQVVPHTRQHKKPRRPSIYNRHN